MRWGCVILDPEEKVAKSIGKHSFTDVVCLSSYHGIIRWAEEHWRDYDHIFLVYDGHWLLDGPANHAMYSSVYGNRTLNHLTVNLIDHKMMSNYGDADFFNEIKDVFKKTFLKENK